jgi:hypothetical protein
MKYPVSVVMVLLLVVAALPHAYALRVNTTANLQVPLSVKVTGTDAEGSGSGSGSTTPALDATTLTTAGAALVGLAVRWHKSEKHEQRFDDRTVTAAQTTMSQAESLKQTDKGIEELLNGLSTAIGMIPGVPDQAKKVIEDQLNGWRTDNQKYYENAPAKPTDLSKDPVVKKLGEVQKISEKND